MSVGPGKGVLPGLIPVGGKEFLNARWVVFCGAAARLRRAAALC
jgi:hypothetical protein